MARAEARGDVPPDSNHQRGQSFFMINLYKIMFLLPIAAACFSALAYPSKGWQVVLGGLTLMLLLIGLLGVLFERGRARIAFAGFSLCGWTCLLATSLLLPSQIVSHLPTKELFGEIAFHVHPSTISSQDISYEKMQTSQGMAEYAALATQKAEHEIKINNFILISESLFVMFFGFSGGWLSYLVIGKR